jgi:glycerol-3-phosphate dehydrogenase
LARIEALVIGGGATGVGIARDLAMRGAEVLLLEQKDFGSGASGGNHGVLHSGARYAVKDPESARQCSTESKVLRSIAPYCIDDRGGIFIGLPGDDDSYGDKLIRAANPEGVRIREITLKEALDKEPCINREAVRALEVDSASVDAFALVLGNVESARRAGARLLNYQGVESFKVSRGSIDEVTYRDSINGEVERIKPEVVINAAGAGAGRIAQKANLRLPLKNDKGTMVVLDGRMTHGLVNRLRMPSDGDIVVPNHSASILGTTSSALPGPQEVRPTREEVLRLIEETSLLIPAIKKARAVRAYSGVRPLTAGSSEGREAGRGFQVLDHADQKVDNLISVVGGKLTTYRLMAEKASDLVCRKLGNRVACRTATELLLDRTTVIDIPTVPDFVNHRMLRKYGPRQPQVAKACMASPRGKELICSCEQILRGEVEHFSRDPDVRTLTDLMRRTRVGMGFCQSGLCALQALSATGELGPHGSKRALEDFLTERWKGIEPVLEGEQLRQEAFKSYLYSGTYRLRLEGDSA